MDLDLPSGLFNDLIHLSWIIITCNQYFQQNSCLKQQTVIHQRDKVTKNCMGKIHTKKGKYSNETIINLSNQSLLWEQQWPLIMMTPNVLSHYNIGHFAHTGTIRASVKSRSQFSCGDKILELKQVHNSLSDYMPKRSYTDSKGWRYPAVSWHRVKGELP